MERGSREANTRALATSVSPNVLKPLLETGCRSVRQTDVDYWPFATFLISGRDRRFRGKAVTQEHPAGVDNDVNEPKRKSYLPDRSNHDPGHFRCAELSVEAHQPDPAPAPEEPAPSTS